MDKFKLEHRVGFPSHAPHSPHKTRNFTFSLRLGYFHSNTSEDWKILSKEHDQIPTSDKMSKEYDIESGKPHFKNETDSSEFISDDGAIPAETFVIGDTWYAKTQRLAGKFGVEQRGIERVPSDERLDAGMSQIGTLVSSKS